LPAAQARRFAETQAKIEQARADVIAAADGKPRREFRFANEKSAEGDDGPLELPNPLVPRRAIN
jgi:hypothetical protein